MPDTVTESTLRIDLEQKRDERGRELDTLIDEREAARLQFEALEEPEDEQVKAEDASELDFRAQVENLEQEMNALAERVEQQRGKEQRRQNAEMVVVSDRAKITEPMVYTPDNPGQYWQDLMMRDRKVQEATILDWRSGLERLERHGRQMEEVIPKEEAERKRSAEKAIETAEANARGSLGRQGVLQRELVSPFERRVSPSREPGHGGEFVPPKWEIDQYSPFLRAGRVIAQLPQTMPLAPGTDVVKVPRVKTGSEVAAQLADNSGLASKDIETEFIEAPVKTIGGIQDVALQVIEMSPGQIFGRMVMEDLTADWNRRVDREVSFGAGTEVTKLNAGTIKGLYPASNWGGKARESAEARFAAVMLGGLGANRAFIALNRFNTDDVVHVLNPAQAEFIMNSYESGTLVAPTGRRLLEPSRVPQFNASGTMEDPIPAEGLVWQSPHGSLVYQTANIPTLEANKAATTFKGTEEGFSYGLTFKRDDVWLFESDARMSVFSEVLSGTLTVRYRLYSYIAMLVRFEPSVQVCGGTPFAKEPIIGGYKYGV